MRWFFPSWNGDVRVESDPKDSRRTILTVIEPTAFELQMLESANNVFRAKKWVEPDTKMWRLDGDQERQETIVQASLFEVGLILLGRLKPGAATLTAVTNLDGTVEAMGSAEPGFMRWINEKLHGEPADVPAKVNIRDQEGYAKLQMAKQREAELRKIKAEEEAAQKRAEEEERKERERMEAVWAAEAVRKREAEERRKKEEEERKKREAATVKRPTPCCPDAIPGVIKPAQEVLLAFCTPEQRDQWLRERRLVACGGLTGHRYLLAHRHTPTAIRNTKIGYDLDDECIMHFHDWTVPPEEEVLAAKLILEHRESWLRNQATCFNGSHVFRNPFGDGGDGTHDAGFTRDFGQALRKRMTTR